MSEIRDFLLPDLGEGLTEAEVVRWLVEEGDTVAVDQPVVEVTTEKAAVEVPTPFAGTVVTLHGSPGDMIKVGTPLISIAIEGEAGAPLAHVPTAAGSPGEMDSPSLTSRDSASGNVLVGYGTSDEARTRRARVALGDAGAGAATATGAASVAASPPVRRRAAELGIDLATVSGTGPGGLVTLADLERAAAGAPAATAKDGSRGSTRRPLTGVDRVAADRLTRSYQEIPTATAVLTADATALLQLRTELEAGGGARVTPFAVLLRQCVRALQRFPRLNAHFDAAGNEIVMFDAVDLGVAVQTERGLVVPVIRGAHLLSPQQLAAELDRLAGRARSGTSAASELTGSTFTVSNFGAFGIDGGTALINPPEVAILGVGRMGQRPWIVDGRVEGRTTVELSLVFDHRASDGAVAGGFLRHLVDLIEQPGEERP